MPARSSLSTPAPTPNQPIHSRIYHLQAEYNAAQKALASEYKGYADALDKQRELVNEPESGGGSGSSSNGTVIAVVVVLVVFIILGAVIIAWAMKRQVSHTLKPLFVTHSNMNVIRLITMNRWPAA